MTVSKRKTYLIQIDRLFYRAIRWWRRIRPVTETRLHEQLPWCSQNVWAAITEAYKIIDRPCVFEYGMGASTLWHVRELLTRGGHYSGVEHRPEWYERVVEGLIGWAQAEGIKAECEQTSNAGATEACVRLESLDGSCEARLLLRQPDVDAGTEDGSAEQYASYIATLNRPFDVVVVDGRARVACVGHALTNKMVRPGGTLVLHDAGRGRAGWLRHEGASGTSDYRPAVEQMLEAGGQIVDGDGLDAWTDKGARRAGVNAFTFPVEACFLRIPFERAPTD